MPARFAFVEKNNVIPVGDAASVAIFEFIDYENLNRKLTYEKEESSDLL